jgi:hypothetical protein
LDYSLLIKNGSFKKLTLIIFLISKPLSYLQAMNFGLRHWTTLLLLIWLSYDTNAQRFPVSATIQILPPYTPYLSDYVSPGQDHIRITLINLDLKEPSIPVKLRINIEGQGYSFTSGKNVATIPITLQANTPITLTNEDLRPYIAPGTSLIQSLKTNTSNTSKLNEGAYQFCVEVYHYIRDETPISDMACTVAFLQELDPPIIVAPSFDVIPGNPQAMMIAWHTQHFGGFPVDYELSLYEKIPGMGDQAIVDFTAPIFRQTTPGLAYLYRTDDPPLVIGKTYLARVKVRDALGRNLFKNHGYSTIAHFQYGRSCDPPLITDAKLFPDGHAHISWTTESNHSNQEIRYRYHDDPNWTVSSVTSALQHLSTSAFHQYAIPITKPSGPLQVQIGASCYNTIAVESAIESIKLDRKSLPRGFYSCGMESSVLDSASTTLITDLKNEDTISANGYLVIIKSANKSGDTYSGECGVMIPMFKGAIIKGHFYDVKVNEDYMMIAGNIKLESAGVQLLSDKYLDLLDGLIETAKTAHDILSQATFQSAIEYLRPYLGMFLNDSLKDQLKLAIDNLDHASTPEEQLKAQEQLTEVLKDIADAIKLLYDAPYQINFFADKNQRYGFDKFKPAVYKDLIENYDKLSIAKKEYYVPFKSLEEGKGDLLLAKPEVESTDQILFILEDSTEVPATKLSDGSYQLTLPPFPSKGEYNLYAVIKDANPTDSTHDEHIAGQCKIVVYEPQKNNVILIPINGAKVPESKSIQDQLNKIYAPAVSQWNVTTQENLDVPGFDNTLDSISTGLLSTYTAEMRTIIKAYIAKYQDDTSSYHLFIVNGSAEQGLLGFMPKKRAYGFITNTDATTIAHELGHGAFRLNHLFEDYTGLRSRTDNLMDYNTPQGSELLHYQWEEVHHPAPIVGWLQGDDEGELSTAECAANQNMIRQFLDQSQSVNYLKLLRAESNLIKEVTIKDKIYKVASYVENGIQITYFIDAWQNSVDKLFYIETTDESLSNKKINKFWLTYGPNSITTVGAIKTTIILKDEMPLPGEQNYCYKDISLPRGISSGELFSELFAKTIFNTVLIAGVAAMPVIESPNVAVILEDLATVKQKDFLIGYTFDLLVQRGIHDIFYPDKPLVLDYVQALSSGVQATISLKNLYSELAVGAAIDCFMNGSIEQSTLRETFDIAECAKGALWSLLIQGGIRGISASIKAIPKEALLDGLSRMIRSPGSSSALYKSGGSAGEDAILRIFRLFHGSDINPENVQSLFKTALIDPAEDWIKHLEVPEIKEAFLESGFFLRFRDLPNTDEEKKEMLRGLLEYGKDSPSELKKILEDFILSGDKREFLKRFKALVSVFKAGDVIIGRVIQKVRPGTNGRIAVIGRQMDGHVNEIVNDLQNQGKQVEAFSEAFQRNIAFDIDGQKYSWQQIKDDFANPINPITGQRKYTAINQVGWIADSDIPNTLIFKANQQWANKLITEGFEIIDMGYPPGKNLGPSLFYNMELSIIFPE